MSVLCDQDIHAYCVPHFHTNGDEDIKVYGIEHNKVGLVTAPLFHPFSEGVEDGVVSFGLTSAGYDVRLDWREMYLFKNTYGEHIDPKRFKDPDYKRRMFDVINPQDLDPETKRGRFVLPPHSYILAQTYEYITMPAMLKGRAFGKSTYARCCVIANLTPLEPEWEGRLTLEIGNLGPSPAVLYIMEGICQIELTELTRRPARTYKDKQGKYQCQQNVTVAKVKEVK